MRRLIERNHWRRNFCRRKFWRRNFRRRKFWRRNFRRRSFWRQNFWQKNFRRRINIFWIDTNFTRLKTLPWITENERIPYPRLHFEKFWLNESFEKFIMTYNDEVSKYPFAVLTIFGWNPILKGVGSERKAHSPLILKIESFLLSILGGTFWLYCFSAAHPEVSNFKTKTPAKNRNIFRHKYFRSNSSCLPGVRTTNWSTLTKISIH